MCRDHQIYRQYAYLKITGYGSSSVITQQLGIEPDSEWSEGDDWTDREPNKKRFFMRWTLDSGNDQTVDLNTQIRAILIKLMRKRSALQHLSGDYDISMVCVSYSLQNFGFALDFDIQRDLTAFGLPLEFNAYIDEDVHELVRDLKDQLKNREV